MLQDLTSHLPRTVTHEALDRMMVKRSSNNIVDIIDKARESESKFTSEANTVTRHS